MNQRPPLTPAVLVLIDSDSRLVLLQDEAVQVVFVDERVDNSVILMPRQNQSQAIYERLVNKFIFSQGDDVDATAANAISQIQSLNIITAGRKAE